MKKTWMSVKGCETTVDRVVEISTTPYQLRREIKAWLATLRHRISPASVLKFITQADYRLADPRMLPELASTTTQRILQFSRAPPYRAPNELTPIRTGPGAYIPRHGCPDG